MPTTSLCSGAAFPFCFRYSPDYMVHQTKFMIYSTVRSLQKWLFGMNPEKGSKGGRVLLKRMVKGPQKNKSVTTCVGSLLEKLIDFKGTLKYF